MATLAATPTGKAGKPSAYQLQATGRAKRATRQVAVAETKVRAAARVLTDALKLADTARAAVEAVNKTYGTDYPGSAKYVDVMAEAGIPDALAKAVEAAPTPEYPPLVGVVKDSPDGAALDGSAVFGEYEAPVPAKETKSRKAKEAEAEAAKV